VIVDSLGMFDLAAGMPEQVRDAAARGQGLDRLPSAEMVEKVVIMGMGGSGMAGEVVAAVTASMLPVPVIVSKSYECPAYVDSGTLVFAISASGDTEETVQAATDAAVAGARMVVVTGGGQLAELAHGWDVPVIEVPAIIPQPRAALGAMAIPPLVVLEEIGLYRGAHQWIGDAVDQLSRRRDALVAGGESSEAAEVARRIGRTMALVHGGGALGAVAAQRWKTQINENAKAPAWWAVQSELCHNEICGWGQHGDVTRQTITGVFLRHEVEHPQIGRRFELVGDIMREVVADIIEVRAQGDSDLAQLLDLILVGDFVSLWMAAFAGIDPGPVPTLVELKEHLGA